MYQNFEMAKGTYHKIINGDSRQMSELKEESIHLVVTSPPYWQLKDYGSENQIGFHDDYETYINHLPTVSAVSGSALPGRFSVCLLTGQILRKGCHGRTRPTSCLIGIPRAYGRFSA